MLCRDVVAFICDAFEDFSDSQTVHLKYTHGSKLDPTPFACREMVPRVIQIAAITLVDTAINGVTQSQATFSHAPAPLPFMDLNLTPSLMQLSVSIIEDVSCPNNLLSFLAL